MRHGVSRCTHTPFYLVAAASCLMVGVGGVLRPLQAWAWTVEPRCGQQQVPRLRGWWRSSCYWHRIHGCERPWLPSRTPLSNRAGATRSSFAATGEPPSVRAASRAARVEDTWPGSGCPLVPDRAYRVVASLAPANRTPDAAVAVRAYVNGRMMAWERLPDEQFGEIAFDVEADAVRSHNVVQLSANRLPQQSLSVELSGSHPLVEEPLVTLRSLHIVMRDATPEPEQP